MIKTLLSEKVCFKHPSLRKYETLIGIKYIYTIHPTLVASIPYPCTYLIRYVRGTNFI